MVDSQTTDWQTHACGLELRDVHRKRLCLYISVYISICYVTYCKYISQHLSPGSVWTQKDSELTRCSSHLAPSKILLWAVLSDEVIENDITRVECVLTFVSPQFQRNKNWEPLLSLLLLLMLLLLLLWLLWLWLWLWIVVVVVVVVVVAASS